MRRPRPHATTLGPALAAAAVLSLCGCPSIERAAVDRTKLGGDVPDRLDRMLVVAVEGADAALAAELVAAVEDELIGRDLFDRVDAVAGVGSAARLTLRLLEAVEGEVWDGWELSTGWVSRFELEVGLADGAGAPVLTGHVTGLGVDRVSDAEDFSPDKRLDLRAAALHDAAVKVSRALRRAADERGLDALDGLVPLRLSPGAGPVAVALLGVDDEPGARRLRGGQLEAHLGEALAALGQALKVSRPEEVRRAADRPPTQGWLGLDEASIQPVAAQLPVQLFLVGRVSAVAGRFSAELRALDRDGRVVFRHQATAGGLGALRVLAVDLARAVSDGVRRAFDPS